MHVILESIEDGWKAFCIEITTAFYVDTIPVIFILFQLFSDKIIKTNYLFIGI